jgi:hypothetical protein
MRRQIYAVVTALFLPVSMGCSRSLDELEPFPCANDGGCPDGRACMPGVGCVRPTEDVPCVVGSTDCAAISEAHVCAAGICTTPCRRAADCGPGRTCSSPDGVDGYCLADCTQSRSCSPGLTCRPLWRQGLHACFGGTFKVNACRDVEVDFLCAKACGTYILDDVVDCGDGTYCSASSWCSSGDLCECHDGAATSCSGEPCTGANCPAGSWWCQPAGFGGVGCKDELARFAARCECWSGAVQNVSCGSHYTCEQLCADECDVVKQDCPDPARPKCSEVVHPDGHAATQCVPLTGARQHGDPCARRGNALSDIGHDDCDRGLYCSLYDINPTAFRCRQHCNGSVGCGAAGEQCIPNHRVSDPSSSTALCREACDPFTGSGCPPGVGCKPGGTSGYCSLLGLGGPGEPCRVGSDCASNTACTRSGYCAPPCDAAHPCPEGMECETAPGAPLGLCIKP